MDETENVSSRVNSFLQAHLFNTKLFGNDSVLIDLLYQYQLGQNSRFCPVPMPVKKKEDKRSLSSINFQRRT